MTKANESYPTPEHKEGKPDNAPKFVLGEPLSAEFLDEHGEKSYKLVIDWLDTLPESETKVVRKIFPNDTSETLLITKVTKDGQRTAVKKPITDEAYAKSVSGSVEHLEKVRTELTFNGFPMKYDVFSDQDRVLEVEPHPQDESIEFDTDNFPYALSPVSGIDGPAVVEWLRARAEERSR